MAPMMRKFLGWGLMAATLAAGQAWAGVDITVRGQYFYPTEKAFRDIYGGGWKPGGEIGFRLTRRLDIWAGGEYFSRSGKLTFTQEETKLSLLPAGAGLRYRLTTGTMSLYAGGGVLLIQFKESNAIGSVSRPGFGAVGRAGVFLRVVRGFLLHLGVGYSYCPMKPADFDIDVGGLEGGAGLAVEF